MAATPPPSTPGRPPTPRFEVRRAAVVLVLFGVFALVALGLFGLRDDGSEPAAGRPAATATAGDGSGTTDGGGDGSGGTTAGEGDQGSSAGETTTTPTPTTTAAPLPPYDGFVDPASSGRPWGDEVAGYLTFRGNPTRSWMGVGPVPANPKILWRYPGEGGLCSQSSSRGETKVWCGTGWTGQPNVWERPDGSTWVMFGAYDAAYHFLDAATGRPALPKLATGDINKGSATLDPDGYPLYYAGSRDNYLRVVALDRAEPTTLWKYAHDTVQPTMWNSDWDGAALVLDDYLLAGGENSRFQVWKLNRGYGADGKVTVDPKLIGSVPGWDQQLLNDVGDKEVSIENSVAVSGNTAYFSNSGGLVQGWDLTPVKSGQPPQRVFRFWTGDDTDASIVVDPEGFLYVSSEYQRFNRRGTELGQLLKLDPRKPDDPVVWSWKDQGYRGNDNAAGIWSTPALHGGVVITSTNQGKVVGLDQQTGQELWSFMMEQQSWPSPVVVDDVLIVGDCAGNLKAFDIPDPRVLPTAKWSMKFPGCVEATPTVYEGRIYLGTRDGGFYALGD